MTKAQKTKWIKALRSGKYKQSTEGYLRSIIEDNQLAFCCLGVACEIGITNAQKNSFYTVENTFTEDKFLPEHVQVCLAELNDDGIPFEVIAGVIDQWVEVSDV